VRQPFSQSEIGLYKSVVLANRLNLFWGLGWEGVPERLDTKRRLDGVDIVMGCVDTRKARAAIAKCAADWSEVDYWLDLGNNFKYTEFTSNGVRPAFKCSSTIPLSPPYSKALTSVQITSNHEARGSAKRTILACASAISFVTTSP
jgi:hypothetical protein